MGKLNFPVLSDIKKEISRSYGVLLDAGFALRATFIIDPKQIIRQITVNDLPIGRSVDETLRLVEACKFVDDNGEGMAIAKMYKLKIFNDYNGFKGVNDSKIFF